MNYLLFQALKLMSYTASAFTIFGGLWLLWASFFKISRRNRSVWSYLHHFGGIVCTVLVLVNVFALLSGTNMHYIEMMYIGIAMFLVCFFSISVVHLLPRRNTRIHRVFAFAATMGTNIGISHMFQYATYRYNGEIYFKDKVAMVVCSCLILYGFIVTSLDLTDCFLLALFGDDRNPMKCILTTPEDKAQCMKMNGIYRVFVHSVRKIFEKRINAKRSDGEEPMTTIKTPVIWLGLISQMGACIDYGWFNYIIWTGQACKDTYLTGIMLRQQFLLGVVPNVFAMFMATLVFRGQLKVTSVLITLTAGWLFFAFANLWTHLIVFENHEQYHDVSFWFPLTYLC